MARFRWRWQGFGWFHQGLGRRNRRGANAKGNRLATASPFEVYFVVFIIAGGLPLLIGGPAPRSLDVLVDQFWQYLWGLELVVGGTTKLVGIFRGRVQLRIAGLRLMGWASVAYVTAIATSLTPGSPAAMGYIGGFGVACFAQVRFLRRAVAAVTRRSSEP
jgi:hypothetical protein